MTTRSRRQHSELEKSTIFSCKHLSFTAILGGGVEVVFLPSHLKTNSIYKYHLPAELCMPSSLFSTKQLLDQKKVLEPSAMYIFSPQHHLCFSIGFVTPANVAAGVMWLQTREMEPGTSYFLAKGRRTGSLSLLDHNSGISSPTGEQNLVSKEWLMEHQGPATASR